MKDYLSLVAKVKYRYIKYGDSFQPPASQEQIAELLTNSLREIDYEIGQDYIRFLSLMNGLDWNGFSVYATTLSLVAGRQDQYIMGFVERNQQYGELVTNRRFVAYGESGDARFAYDTLSKKFTTIDQATTDLIENFDSFSSMLYRLLELSLL